MSDAGAVHAERHREAAGDQHDGVDAAEPEVELAAPLGEPPRVEVAVDGVERQHPTEEHDLGGEEDPHAEGRGLALLVDVVELMGECLRVLSHARLAGASTRTARS